MGIRPAQSPSVSNGGDFDSVFASSLRDAEAVANEMAPIIMAGDSVCLLATQTSSFDTYRTIDLLTDNVDTPVASKIHMG